MISKKYEWSTMNFSFTFCMIKKAVTLFDTICHTDQNFINLIFWILLMIEIV